MSAIVVLVVSGVVVVTDSSTTSLPPLNPKFQSLAILAPPIPITTTITEKAVDLAFGTNEDLKINKVIANGNNKFPKEKIEIFVGGKILELNNFRVLKGYGWKRFRKYKTFIQDKGHRASTKAFIKSLIDGTQLIKAEDIFEVSQATIELDGILNKKN